MGLFRKIACPNFCIHVVDSLSITFNTYNSLDSWMISFCFEFDNFFHLFKVFMSTEVIVVLVYLNVFFTGQI